MAIGTVRLEHVSALHRLDKLVLHLSGEKYTAGGGHDDGDAGYASVFWLVTPIMNHNCLSVIN